jgi:hypothetical protein
VDAGLDSLMAGQAFFAYRVQLPDGSEAIRTGGAERPPTFGELADYAANQGERFLGPAQMSPAVTPAAPARTAAPPPAPPPPTAPPPSAAAGVLPSEVVPTSGMVPASYQPPPVAALPAPAPAAPSPGVLGTLFPPRTFASELPSIGGAVLAGGAVAPLMPAAAPFAAGAGSAAGELGQVGLEQVMGWPPAEPGPVTERMGRAYARGVTGEAVAAPVRWGARYAVGAVKPLLEAAEALKPVLSQTLPETVQAVPDAAGGFRRIGRLLADPAELAAANLTPEGRETLLRAWWQRSAPGGPAKVIQAWDALGEAGQRVLAGEQHGAMSTVVEGLRSSGGLPIAEMTPGQIARASVPGAALAYAGHPFLGAGLTLATEEASKRGPRLLLYPPAASFLGSLPQVGRVASPFASPLLRTGTQAGTALRWPPTQQ